MKKLILASSSPYRSALLQRLNLSFDALSPDIDEAPRKNESPEELVSRLASEKALVIAKDFDHAVVIGSDQVATVNNTILTKPGNINNALTQLMACSGNTVTFYTSLCVVDTQSNTQLNVVEPFTVGFRKLTEQQIMRYLQIEKPFDCAGSFKAEGMGITLFTHLSGRDPNSLIGLPLIALTSFLQQLGLDPLGER
ncbi:MAG: Maf-like protein YceF [Glaciecola sp. HTCC2999]|jgi:septum formation protein|nr:MAG: Maf-like protein YceF [Glaciecola sp. HTCC2999]